MVGPKEKNEVSQGNGEEKESLWEEILSSLLKKAGLKKIVEGLKSDNDDEKKVAEKALKEFLQGEKSDAKKELWKKVLTGLESKKEEDREEVVGELAKFLREDEGMHEPTDDEKNNARELLEQAEGLKADPKKREENASETLELLGQIEGELGEKEAQRVEKLQEETREKIRELIDGGGVTSDLNEGEGDEKNKIKEELEGWLKRKEESKLPKNKKGKRFKNLRDEALERAKNIKIIRGFQIAKEYLGKTPEERKRYLNEISDSDYEDLYVVMIEIQESKDKEFANLHRLLRNIADDYNATRMSEAIERVEKRGESEVRRGVENRASRGRKTTPQEIDWDEFRNMSPQEQAKILLDMNFRVDEDQWESLSPDEKKNVIDNINASIDMARGGSRPEFLRNLNYGYYQELEMEFRKRLKREGVSFEGHIIDDYAEIVGNRSNGVTAPQLNSQLTGRAKEIAEATIYQALLREVRELSKQGLEGNVIYQDVRGSKYLTYLATGGVNPDIKDTITKHMLMRQFGYLYRNHYVNDELFMKILSVFAQQGPEYRWFEELAKMEEFALKNKEGNEVMFEANVYDYEGIFGENITQEFKNILGKIIGRNIKVERTFGTLNGKYTDPTMMKLVRVLTQQEILRRKFGDEFEQTAQGFGTEKLIEVFGEEKGRILVSAGITDFALEAVGEAEHYFNEAMVMMTATGRADEVMGNASLDDDHWELPQAFPEYYMKRLPRLMCMFLLTYTPIRSPELIYGIINMGLTSFYAMNRGEVMAHFLSDSDTGEGALGVMSTFIRNGNKDHAKLFREMFDEAFFDRELIQIEKDKSGREVVKDDYIEILRKMGVAKGMESMRSWSAIKQTLLEKEMSTRSNTKYDAMFEAIDWNWAIKQYGHNKRLVAALSDQGKTGREKFRAFVAEMNSSMFVTTALKAKRGDYFMKYRGEYQIDFFKKAVAYLNNPDFDTLDEMTDVVKNLVGPKSFSFWEGNRRLLRYFLKRRANGESYQVARYKDGAVVMTSSKSLAGNKGEFMLPELKMAKCNIYDPDIKGRSVADHHGLHKVYEEAFFDDMSTRTGYAKGYYLSDEHYEAERQRIRREKILKGMWPHLKWVRGNGLGANLVYNAGVWWEVATFKQVFDWLSRDILGLTPAMFWDWVFGNVEKDASALWKYFNS